MYYNIDSVYLHMIIYIEDTGVGQLQAKLKDLAHFSVGIFKADTYLFLYFHTIQCVTIEIMNKRTIRIFILIYIINLYEYTLATCYT